jgi:hypothetical protein
MNNVRIVESTDFTPIFQKYEQQLYDVRSRLIHFYNNIKDQDLSPGSNINLQKLYSVFSELDELAHMKVDNEMCKLILKDPVIRSLLPAVHTSYSNFFSLHETQLARKILDSKDPWGMLRSFPLYSRYERLISDHVENSPEIKVLAFIGCGPLPVTLLLFSKLYGIRCIGIDRDQDAVTLAKDCIEHFGLEEEINIVLGDETALSEFEWDSVLIAGLTEPKRRIFRNLYNITRKKKSTSNKQISVCYRNYTGMRQLLYQPVNPEHIRGFRKIKEIYPSGGVNNTLVFLECE